MLSEIGNVFCIDLLNLAQTQPLHKTQLSAQPGGKLCQGMAMERLVYFDAENTQEGREHHAFHMTVGRVLRVHGSSLYVAMCDDLPMWIAATSARPCLATRGPYFVGDFVFGILSRDHDDKHPEEWCPCFSVGLVRTVKPRGVAVDFGHDRGGEVIHMRRCDIRLATKGATHLAWEEMNQLVRPVAATCRHAACLLRKPHADRVLACGRAIAGLA